MLRPDNSSDIPKLTKEVVKACFPKGNIYIRLPDEIGTLYIIGSKKGKELILGSQLLAD